MPQSEIQKTWFHYPLVKKLWISFLSGVIVALLVEAVVFLYILGAFAYKEFFWNNIEIANEIIDISQSNINSVEEFLQICLVWLLISGFLNMFREGLGSVTLQFLGFEMAYGYSNAFVALVLGLSFWVWFQRLNKGSWASVWIWILTIVASLVLTLVYTGLCETVRNVILDRADGAEKEQS